MLSRFVIRLMIAALGRFAIERPGRWDAAEQEAPAEVASAWEARRSIGRGLAFLEKDARAWREEQRCVRERNHNLIRLWAWVEACWAPWSDGKGQNPSDWFIGPNPYARTGPGKALDGKPMFDLEKWDDAYFDRLRTRVRQAGERGIYVSVMLFQGWSSAKPWLGGTPWRGHPYHPANNVQGFNGNLSGNSGPALDDPRVRGRRRALPADRALTEVHARSPGRRRDEDIACEPAFRSLSPPWFSASGRPRLRLATANRAGR